MFSFPITYLIQCYSPELLHRLDEDKTSKLRQLNTMKYISNIKMLEYYYFQLVFFFFKFFLMFIIESQRESEHEQGRGRGRGRHRIPSRLQALSCQHRAPCRPWDHDLSRSQMLNRLSHPGAPVLPWESIVRSKRYWKEIWIQGHRKSFSKGEGLGLSLINY